MALSCLLRKRGKGFGPIALVLFPLLLYILASDPAWHSMAAILGGAALMLMILFLVAVQYRRRAINRNFKNAPNRLVHIVIEERGLSVTSALGESTLNWRTIERIWRCDRVALVFHQGWNYIAFPTHAVPTGALEFAEQCLRAKP